ncbi:ATP-binding protein, partial [Limnobacter sp.]|uniref:sensor histidine kinase n=1 Tax=Limnobacter sp. TaxID=2003368 RepID=UPI002587E207
TMPDGSAELEVEDTGPGIPERARINVLKRHVRLDTEGQKGAGLGLAIVNNIVADHNASIVIANSHANSGTRFVVRFPA